MVKAFCFLILWEKGWQQASSSNLLTPAVFHLMFFWAKGIWTWNFLTFDFKIVDSFFFILRIMPSSPPVLKLATRSSLKKSKYNLYCVKSVQIRSFFWSVISRIPTEYGEILVSVRIQSTAWKVSQERSFFWSVFSCFWTPYSVQMRENTYQKKLRIWILLTQCFHAVLFFAGILHLS